MNPRIQALLFLHIAVFLWGFTAILGKLISYSSFYLVWHRMLFTAAVYFCIPSVWRGIRKISKKNLFVFLGIGAIVCAHWLTFYGSIKLGNSASVTLACLGSASFFAAILEPFLTRTAHKPLELILGALVIGGIVMIYFAMPSDYSNADVNYSAAIITGLISAFLAALFTVLNKKNIEKTDTLTLSAIEMLSGALLLSVALPFLNAEGPVFPGWNPENGNLDLLWMFLLVVVCTNLTFYLGAYALKELSAFTSNLTVNLEPVYGIVLGALIFKENEQLNIWFYLGAGLILVAIFSQSIISVVKRRKNTV